MALVRMRYPHQALAELKKEDPDTPVTLYYIRRLAASGAIPVREVGRRRLINYDALLEYLAGDEGIPQPQSGAIRKVDERGGDPNGQCG